MRLPQYVRALTRLSRQGIELVSSEQLGRQIQMTSAQIRKDLSYFGRFGKQGEVTRFNGILLLATYVGYTGWLVSTMPPLEIK